MGGNARTRRELIQGLAFDKFHVDGHRVAFDLQPMHAHNVGMVKGGNGPGFLLETFGERRLLIEMLVEHFQGDFPL